MDCKEGEELLNDTGTNRSPVAGLIHKLKSLLPGIRPHKFLHAGRSCNAAAHCMAQMGRGAQRTAIWFHSGPDDLRMICENECNDIT